MTRLFENPIAAVMLIAAAIIFASTVDKVICARKQEETKKTVDRVLDIVDKGLNKNGTSLNFAPRGPSRLCPSCGQ